MPARLRHWSLALACCSPLACDEADEQPGLLDPAPEIPLGSCDAASGPSWGGPAVPECTTDPAPWCGDGCPVTSPVALVCDWDTYAALRVGPDGTPWLLAHVNRDMVAALLVKLGPKPSLTPAPKLSIGAALAIDGDGAPHLIHTTEQPNARLRHRGLAGVDDDIACIAGPVPIWIPQRLIASAGSLIGLVKWIAETEGGLAMVRRDGEGAWSLESLPIAGDWPTLALADDGTPLVAHYASEPNGWRARMLVGDAMVALPFAPSPVLTYELALVPGADSFLAAVRLGETHVEVALPDQSAAILDEMPVLAAAGCATPVDSCSGACNVNGVGTAFTPAAVRDGDAIVLIRVEDTIDRDGHFEGDLCPGSGAGCSCDLITDEDRSRGELVLTRVSLPALDAKEIARVALPFGPGGRVQVDVAGDRKIVVALAGGDRSRTLVGTIDLATLP